MPATLISRSNVFAVCALAVCLVAPADLLAQSAVVAALPEAPHAVQQLVASETAPDTLPPLAFSSFQQDSQKHPLKPPPEQKPGEPSLDDLGLPAAQTKGDADLQARLDRRAHMLKMHQRMGLITLAPLAAACISSAAAPPDPRNGGGNAVGRDIHLALGSVSVLSYSATAYYAIRAPRVADQPARGGIKLHKYLIYIHAPGMILTPILGAMAFNQANNGEKVHGIASAHAAVAWTTIASYSAAIVAVSWPIHLRH